MGIGMEENKREFLENVCNLYMVVLLAVLPLYTRGTYWQLGDDKYLLFRNVSIVCLFLWAAAECLFLACRFLGKRTASFCKRKSFRFSTMDFFMAFYGASAVISFLLSPYRETAWGGYRDWYMGTLSQILFVGIYFFVSRSYRGSALPLYLGEAALFAVTVIGLLNRLGIDPLKMLSHYQMWDWEYRHMVSTIGNSNWLCGYYSAAAALAVTGFLYSKRRIKSVLLGLVCVLSLLLLCIQGSMAGPVLSAACIFCCLALGLKKPEFFEKGLLLFGTTALLLPVTAWLAGVRGSIPVLEGESNVYAWISWKGWYLVGAAVLLLYLGLKGREERRKRRLIRLLFLLFGITVLLAGGLALTQADWGDSWGSGRGVLWRLSLEGFLAADPLHKLVGMGPDCFGEYIYDILPAEQMIQQQGRWKDAVFANAHNEWLNLLVNMGLLGAAAYGGIFVTGLKRYRGMLLGILALLLYGLHSLVSFQQTLNTPLLFLVLGICESRLRSAAAP